MKSGGEGVKKYPDRIYAGLDEYNHRTWGNAPTYDKARQVREWRYEYQRKENIKLTVGLLVVVAMLAFFIWRA